MSAVSPQPRLSFDLDEGMLKALGQEFAPEKVSQQFAQALGRAVATPEIDKVAQQVFGDYGRRWMKRTLELGEKHPDAAYETLKKIIAKTGAMYFPLVPERFVEIAYLGVMSFTSLKVVQNNAGKLAFRLPQCDIYQSVTERSGNKIAQLLPCRHGCLAALDTLFAGLNLKVSIGMEATMPKDGYCQFAASRLKA